MDFDLGFTVLQISNSQMLSIFWAVTVALSFNITYLLFIKDRGNIGVSKSRIWATIFIGTLIVVGTYADVLSEKTFEMGDCLLLALVAAHGWMAEDMVNKFMRRTAAAHSQQPPANT